MNKTLVLALTAVAALVSAQPSAKRAVDVTVKDPLGRIVTGLGGEHFEVVENGLRRSITDFSASEPVSIAIIGQGSLPDFGALAPENEILQALSVDDALRQLAASKNSRKAMVIATTEVPGAIPAGIQTLQIEQTNLARTVASLCNQYRLEFDSSSPSTKVEIVLKQPVGLPRLELTWK